MAGKYFGENVPTIRELEKRTALAFVNTNPVLDHLIPLPENVIPVAGVHIKNPKPIPEVYCSVTSHSTITILTQTIPFLGFRSIYQIFQERRHCFFTGFQFSQ